MKNFFKTLAAFIAGGILLGASVATAGTVLFPYQGGTGTSTLPTLGKMLIGDSNGNYEFVASSTFGGGGSSSFGTTSISALYPLIWNTSTANMSMVATSSLGLTISSFASPNISQWTNNSGYLTSLAGAASSTLLNDFNTWANTQTFGNVVINGTCTGSGCGAAGSTFSTTSVKATYPLSWNTATANMSLLFGTTTNNTWSGLNQWIGSTYGFGTTSQTDDAFAIQTNGTKLIFDTYDDNGVSVFHIGNSGVVSMTQGIDSGYWHGTAIADAYIASAAKWNTFAPFAWTPTTDYGALTNSTGTPIWLQAGLQASSTSHFSNSSTTLETLGSLWLPSLTSGGLAVDANGLVYKSATTTFSSPLVYSPSTNAVTLANTLANGLTATTTFYNGGVVFSDGSKLTQAASPSSLFWDNTNMRLGIGNSTPATALDVKSSGPTNVSITNTAAQATAGGALVQYIQDDGTAMVSGNELGRFYFGGAKDASHNVQGSSKVRAYATENWSSTNAGSNLTFSTTPNTTVGSAERMRIDQNGNIGFGTTSPSSLLQIYSTASTTLSLDNNSSTKGACIEMKDFKGGGYTYLYTYQGVLYSSTASCK